MRRKSPLLLLVKARIFLIHGLRIFVIPGPMPTVIVVVRESSARAKRGEQAGHAALFVRVVGALRAEQARRAALE